MQKKVIALAVAGLVSGAAFAQSNVTIYGVVDLGYVAASGGRTAANSNNANFNGMESGLLAGSRIGFKGEEGLGNGLKTIWTLEYWLSPDQDSSIGNGAGTPVGTAASTQSRQTFVGLEHNKLGALTLGRQYAPGFYASAKNDAWGAAVPGTSARLDAAGGHSIVAGSGARWDNSVNYTSPTWSGFQVRAAYAYAENDRANASADVNTPGNGISQGDKGRFGVGLNYANGPLNLDAAFHQRANANAPANDNINEWYLGASYDFKVAKVFASYQDFDDNIASATTKSNDSWAVGVKVPVFGNGNIIASYGDLNSDQTGKNGSDVWALGYTHALSKRTTLYTTYTYTDNNKVASGQAAGAVASVKADNETNQMFTAGISHWF